eukprot:4235187-Pleurochrysis_carterae.AAC.1
MSCAAAAAATALERLHKTRNDAARCLYTPRLDQRGETDQAPAATQRHANGPNGSDDWHTDCTTRAATAAAAVTSAPANTATSTFTTTSAGTCSHTLIQLNAALVRKRRADATLRLDERP